MIYYSSVLIALIKDCVNFVEVNTICCRFAAELQWTAGTVPLGNPVPTIENCTRGEAAMNHQWPHPAFGLSNSQQSENEDAAP